MTSQDLSAIRKVTQMPEGTTEALLGRQGFVSSVCSRRRYPAAWEHALAARARRVPILTYGGGAIADASHAGRLIDAIVELRAESSEIFTTSPVRGA